MFGSRSAPERRRVDVVSTALWPKAGIVSALKARFGGIEDLGRDDGFSIYGVIDNEIRFAVALVESGRDSRLIEEIGFLALFVGAGYTQADVEAMNRNLHISVASLDASGDLFLIGGVKPTGEFNEASLGLILDSWRRDLLVLLHGGQNLASLSRSAPVARIDAARLFAQNSPTPVGNGAAVGGMAGLLTVFLGEGRSKTTICLDCNGRGRTGFFARSCAPCAGEGFVSR